MRKCSGKQSSGGPAKKDGAFPIISHAISPRTQSPKKGASKLGCAFKALKCSSRAMEEDNLPTQHGHSSDVNYAYSSEPQWQAQFEDSNKHIQSSPAPVKLDLELNNSMSQNSPNNPNSKEGLATENARSFPEETIDKIPVDPDEESESQSQHSKEHTPANVIRIASEDTHDTPQVSNLDPNKSPSQVPTPTEAERRMDELCQKYFNTPKVIHSTASLGDSITPLDSPVDDEEGVNSRCDPPSNAADEAREILQFPAMARSESSESSAYRPRRQSKSSSASSLLYGDGLSDEKKEDDAQDSVLNLNPDNASVKIGQQEVKATISITDTAPAKSMKRLHPSEKLAYETLNTESSFSSVSSFAEVAGAARKTNSNFTNHQNVHQGKSITPHPFFWRSHPKVTVTSYDPQHPKTRIRQVVPKIEAVDFTDFSMSDTSPEQRDIHDGSGEGGKEGHYAPYLHPAVVRKLWMESKPFQLQVNSNWHSKSDSDRHPQGPPSARSHPFVQSLASFAKLPAVFGRSDSSR